MIHYITSLLSKFMVKSFANKLWFLHVGNTSLFENTVGKGEITCNETFLLFPHCFLPVWKTFRHLHQI